MTTATKTGRAPARAGKKRTPLVRRFTRGDGRKLAEVVLVPGRKPVTVERVSDHYLREFQRTEATERELTHQLRQTSQPGTMGAVEAAARERMDRLVDAAGLRGRVLRFDPATGMPLRPGMKRTISKRYLEECQGPRYEVAWVPAARDALRRMSQRVGEDMLVDRLRPEHLPSPEDYWFCSGLFLGFCMAEDAGAITPEENPYKKPFWNREEAR